MNFSLFDIINILSISVQIPLIGVLLFKGRKLVSNRLMIFFFFAQVLFSLDQIYQSHSNYTYGAFPYLAYVAIPFFSVWGPTMYLYIKSETSKCFNFKLKHVLHYLPFILLTIYLLFNFHFYSIEEKKELLSSNKIFTWYHNGNLIYFIGFQVFIYNVISIITIEKFSKDNFFKNKTVLNKIKWNKFIIYGYFIACIFNNIIAYLYYYGSSENIAFYINACDAFFLIYFSVILIKALLSSNFGEKPNTTNAPGLTKNEFNSLNSKLELYMNENKPFLEFGLSLSELADRLEVKERHLSQFINSHFNMSFQDYINLFRIEEAKKIIKDSIGSKKTVLEIVYESGFNSKSAFNFAFKKHTKTSPTNYKKSLQKKHNV